MSRRYRFDPKDAATIKTKVQEGFVPLLKRTPGFIAYYWFDDGNGAGESLSVFQTKVGVDASVGVAGIWVKMNLAGLLGTPEVVQGEVKAHG
ncbi:MAG: hypothetical protein ACHQQS_03610 [Thermoanaerobaculales bacterium]